MDFIMFHQLYEKSLLVNEHNTNMLEKYLENLEALDLKAYSEKLTVPVLVPLGSRILFRGELKHTNEITTALGADYFAKGSLLQAEILKQHRIKVTKNKLELYKKEKDHLLSIIKFSMLTRNDDAGIEITEVETEEEEKAWRKAHRENVRRYKQRKDKDEEEPKPEIPDEELWSRLEELELQEDLQNELTKDDNNDQRLKKPPPAEVNSDKDSDDDVNDNDDNKGKPSKEVEVNNAKVANEIYLANYGNRRNLPQQPSKLKLFELIVDRHNALKKMAALVKSRQKSNEKEQDLLERLNDMEKLEDLEDEIELLEDMLSTDDDDDDDDDSEKGDDEEDDKQIKKSVAFADEDDRETFEIIFKHSNVEPSDEVYDPQVGITKPSDILKAFSKVCNGETTSILKKAKEGVPPVVNRTISVITENQEDEQFEENHDSNIRNTIVVRDVVEKVDSKDSSTTQNARPMSLFKKARQQLKE